MKTNVVKLEVEVVRFDPLDIVANFDSAEPPGRLYCVKGDSVPDASRPDRVAVSTLTRGFPAGHELRHVGRIFTADKPLFAADVLARSVIESENIARAKNIVVDGVPLPNLGEIRNYVQRITDVHENPLPNVSDAELERIVEELEGGLLPSDFELECSDIWDVVDWITGDLSESAYPKSREYFSRWEDFIATAAEYTEKASGWFAVTLEQADMLARYLEPVVWPNGTELAFWLFTPNSEFRLGDDLPRQMKPIFPWLKPVGVGAGDAYELRDFMDRFTADGIG